MEPGDSSIEFLFRASEMTTVTRAFEEMDLPENQPYRGVTLNIIMVDTSGNIGYQLLAPLPVRKDKTPYLGLRVLDGRTSAYDWEGNGSETVPLSEIPRSLNPSKGFLVTANNR